MERGEHDSRSARLQPELVGDVGPRLAFCRGEAVSTEVSPELRGIRHEESQSRSDMSYGGRCRSA